MIRWLRDFADDEPGTFTFTAVVLIIVTLNLLLSLGVWPNSSR